MTNIFINIHNFIKESVTNVPWWTILAAFSLFLFFIRSLIRNGFNKNVEEKKHDLEIFKSQLKNLDELNEKYYVAYITNIIELNKQLNRKRLKEFPLFFSFSKWICIRDKWKKERNSFIILKSHTAEKIIVHLSQSHMYFFDKYFMSKDDRHTLSKILKENTELVECYSSLNNEINSNEEMKGIYKRFQQKIGSLDKRNKKFINLKEGIDIFSRIFDSEIYHCHETWYKNTYYPPTFTRDQQKIIVDNLSTLFKQKWIRRNEANRFLERICSLYRIGFFGKRVKTGNFYYFARNYFAFFIQWATKKTKNGSNI